jgi:hypothetical protein
MRSLHENRGVQPKEILISNAKSLSDRTMGLGLPCRCAYPYMRAPSVQPPARSVSTDRQMRAVSLTWQCSRGAEQRHPSRQSHGHASSHASRTRSLKSSCIRCGRRSMWARATRTICPLVAPFGMHDPASDSIAFAHISEGFSVLRFHEPPSQPAIILHRERSGFNAGSPRR